jgi:general stress protein YciG
LGKRGGAVTAERHGQEFYETIGRKGGEVNKAKHGPDHFREMGRKGGAKVKALIEAGKAAQASE